MEDAEDSHRARADILDAVHLTGCEMEAGPDAKRDLLAVDVRDACAFDDVTDLVVRVAVERRLRRLHDAEELCHASRLDEIAEAAFRRSFFLRLVSEADDDAASLTGPPFVVSCDDADDDEVVRARNVERRPLARAGEDAAVRFECMLLAVQLERAAA